MVCSQFKLLVLSVFMRVVSKVSKLSIEKVILHTVYT